MTHPKIPAHLAEWAQNCLAKGENVLATSNQGTVLHYQENGVEFVVKTAMGKGAAKDLAVQHSGQTHVVDVFRTPADFLAGFAAPA